MSGNQRLDRLYPALTAKERALLVLRAWKADQEEDAQVRRTMPDSQAQEFNRYIHLMNAANLDAGKYIAALKGISGELNLKAAWLASLQMWGIRVWDVWVFIALHTGEPITESEHRRLVEDARAEMVPLADLAETLVERYDGWTKADLEPGGDDDEPVVKDKAWNRILAEKKKELTRLVEEGVLSGKRRGRGLLINNGSFFDWLGEPVPVCPEWGKGYDVFPDGQADEVAFRKKARLRAQQAIAASPASPIQEALEESVGYRVTDRKERWDEAMAALRERLREDTPWCWQELRAVETVLEEVAREFDGEDPLLPPVRNVLDKAHQELAELPTMLTAVDVEVELPEPDEERVADLRERLLRQPSK
jgi:hypothetical protein